MSNQLYRPAYATRLGNLTAKSVLVLLCDQANDEGLGWPSIASIVKGTEINRRTVCRILEVFSAMELVERKEAEINDRYGRRKVQAIQVDTAKLGLDLTEVFAAAYAASQGKVAVPGRAGRWCLRDGESVSETDSDQSLRPDDRSQRPEVGLRDREPVSETDPPHPLIGRPLTDPVLDPPLTRCARELETPAMDEGQAAHVVELLARGRNADAAVWEKHYREQNLQKAVAASHASAKQAAEEEALRAEYPSLETALARVRKRCGFAWGGAGDELGPVLCEVFRDQEEMGKPVWRTAGQMVAMWELQRAQGSKLRARYGPLKFFRDGHWLDPSGWHWDNEVLKQLGETTAGSKR